MSPQFGHGAARQSCGRCGMPVLHQTSGLPVTVTADAAPLPLADALARTGPNRLAWCLKTSRWAGPRLTECFPSTHRETCTQHVVCHECPPGTPRGRRPGGERR